MNFHTVRNYLKKDYLRKDWTVKPTHPLLKPASEFLTGFTLD